MTCPTRTRSRTAKGRPGSPRLWAVGWSLVPLADRTAAEVVLPADDVEALAQPSTSAGGASAAAAGWRPGPRDTGARTDPHLVPWADLPAEIQQENRDAVLRLPALPARGRAARSPTVTMEPLTPPLVVLAGDAAIDVEGSAGARA